MRPETVQILDAILEPYVIRPQGSQTSPGEMFLAFATRPSR